MMKEAESHADEDKKRREEIEARNKADQALYGAERMIKDTGDKLASADRQGIESAVEDLKKAMEGTDAAAVQRALDQLTAAQHKAAEALYRQQAQATGSSGTGTGAGSASSGGAQPESGGAKGDVIDAEVVDEGKPQ
jgi:molecular chaperone DnaK